MKRICACTRCHAATPSLCDIGTTLQRFQFSFEAVVSSCRTEPWCEGSDRCLTHVLLMFVFYSRHRFVIDVRYIISFSVTTHTPTMLDNFEIYLSKLTHHLTNPICAVYIWKAIRKHSYSQQVFVSLNLLSKNSIRFKLFSVILNFYREYYYFCFNMSFLLDFCQLTFELFSILISKWPKMWS